MLKTKLSSWLKRLGIATCAGVLLCVAFYAVILAIHPFPDQQIDEIKYSKTIFDREGNLLRAFLGKDDCWILPVQLSEVNPNFIKATIAHVNITHHPSDS